MAPPKIDFNEFNCVLKLCLNPKLNLLNWYIDKSILYIDKVRCLTSEFDTLF